MSNSIELEWGKATKAPERREVIKLVTSSWTDKRGLHIRHDLLSVKRKSIGHQILQEDCKMIGSDEVWPRIINLKECKDGIYELIPCNEYRDYESGCIEDYDYKLIPFKDPTQPTTVVG